MIGEHKIKVDGAIHLCGHNFEHGDVPRERKVTLPGIVVHTVTVPSSLFFFILLKVLIDGELRKVAL
jgi:hypothetical protein